MIASAPKPPLIQQYHVDVEKGMVTLTMPDIDDAIALSVRAEVEALKQNTKYPAFFGFKHEGNTTTITIQSNDVGVLAMNCCKLMTRRAEELGSGEGAIMYASADDTRSVLGTLKAHIQTTAPHTAAAIDRLLATVQQIERM